MAASLSGARPFVCEYSWSVSARINTMREGSICIHRPCVFLYTTTCWRYEVQYKYLYLHALWRWDAECRCLIPYCWHRNHFSLREVKAPLSSAPRPPAPRRSHSLPSAAPPSAPPSSTKINKTLLIPERTWVTERWTGGNRSDAQDATRRETCGHKAGPRWAG